MITRAKIEKYFEDVEVGTGLPQLVKEVALEQMAMYSAVCWDFYAMHYDSDTARKLGFQAPYADGPMLTAFLAQVVTDWMGIHGIFKKISASNRVTVFPGDRLTCKGKVTDKHTKGGSNLVECEVWAENQNEERVAYGSTTVELPCKSALGGRK